MRAHHGAQIVAAGAEAKVLTGQAVQLPPAMLVLPAVHCRGEGGRGKDACMQWKLGSVGVESNTPVQPDEAKARPLGSPQDISPARGRGLGLAGPKPACRTPNPSVPTLHPGPWPLNSLLERNPRRTARPRTAMQPVAVPLSWYPAGHNRAGGRGESAPCTQAPLVGL